MSFIFHFNSVPLDDLIFEVRQNSTAQELPKEFQMHVDNYFSEFSNSMEKYYGIKPTKDLVCVGSFSQVLSGTLRGSFRPVSYDEILYFSRTKVSTKEYDYAKRHIGLPFGMWYILTSHDEKVLFVKKRGAEQAYADNPYSAFGSLASTQKDVIDGKLCLENWLERSILLELGEDLAEQNIKIRYLGLSLLDENKAGFNRGYDLIFEISINLTMEEIVSYLSDNTQFSGKSTVQPIDKNIVSLTDFVFNQEVTSSTYYGILCYLHSTHAIVSPPKPEGIMTYFE